MVIDLSGQDLKFMKKGLSYQSLTKKVPSSNRLMGSASQRKIEVDVSQTSVSGLFDHLSLREETKYSQNCSQLTVTQEAAITRKSTL